MTFSTNELSKSISPPIRYSLAIVLLGQIIACFNAGTAVFSKLLVDNSISLSFAQSFPMYLLLNIFFIPLLVSRYNRAKSDPKQYKLQQFRIRNPQLREPFLLTSSSVSDSLLAASPSYPFSHTTLSFIDLILPNHTSLWVYVLLAILDVHGNFAIVKAYQYTSMLAVQLIDSANLPFVLLFSAIFLGRKYTKLQLAACACCVTGLILCIVTDIYHPPEPTGPDGSGNSTSQALLGDALVVLACLGYTCSNIIQEKVLSSILPEPHTAETTLHISNDSDQENFDESTMHITEKMDAKNHHLSDSSQSSQSQLLHNEHSTIQISDHNPENTITLMTTTSHHYTTTTQPADLNESTPLVHWDRTYEYLAYLGLCATFFSAVEGLIFEHDALLHFAHEGVQNPKLFLYLFGFNSCIFLMYLLMPVLIQHSSAVVLNMSLLMTDVYSAIGSIIIFHHSISSFHIGSFVVIGFGIFFYNVVTPYISPSLPPLQKNILESDEYLINDQNAQHSAHNTSSSTTCLK